MNDQKQPPFCKDCKHIGIPELAKGEYLCFSKNAEAQMDIVTGTPNQVSCHAARWNETLCGIEAKWFEKK